MSDPMSSIYASWIEIPAHDLNRATAFYRAVFGLTETPLYINLLDCEGNRIALSSYEEWA